MLRVFEQLAGVVEKTTRPPTSRRSQGLVRPLSRQPKKGSEQGILDENAGYFGPV
jgi:hypothetical protein